MFISEATAAALVALAGVTCADDSLDPNGGDFSEQSCKKFRKWKKLTKLTDNISNQSIETNLRVLLELTSL